MKMNERVVLDAVLNNFVIDHIAGMTREEIHRELIEDSPGVKHIFPHLRGDEVFHLALDITQDICNSSYLVRL